MVTSSGRAAQIKKSRQPFFRCASSFETALGLSG
jgi:hypothetical protein